MSYSKMNSENLTKAYLCGNAVLLSDNGNGAVY